jgi:hypothetical protein
VPTQSADSVSKASLNHLNLQVGLYSVAAAVAGVSLLALAEPAAGEVVVTKRTIPIPMATHDISEPVKISMANNGVDNLSFNLSISQPSAFASFRTLVVDGVSLKDGVITGGSWDPYAVALARGAKIGGSPNSFFNYGDLVELSTTSNQVRYCQGYWGSNLKHFIGCGNPKNKYLGVSFQLNGKTHYGWIRLSVTTNPQMHGPLMSATITAYAYETVANKPILAGTAGTAAASTEKSSAELEVPQNAGNHRGPSLGMLAAGADALPTWRREGIPVHQ